MGGTMLPESNNEEFTITIPNFYKHQTRKDIKSMQYIRISTDIYMDEKFMMLTSKRDYGKPIIIIGLVGVHLLTRNFRARRGQAALYDDVIVTSHPDVLGLVTRGQARAITRWKKITSYRAYTDYVQLHSTEDWFTWWPSIRRAIPTPTDDQRAQVCALLSEREVAQLD